jgi:error-prone DNA polymerase
MACLPDYAELHCLSNFSFLRGASQPEELVARAARLGYAALALTDECSLAGIVRAHVAAKECGLKLIVGSELRLDDGLKLALLAPDRRAYGALSALITGRAPAREERNVSRFAGRIWNCICRMACWSSVYRGQSPIISG